MKKNTVKLQEVLDSLDESLHLANEIVTNAEERAKLGVYFNDILEILWKAYKNNTLETKFSNKEIVKEKEDVISSNSKTQGGVSHYKGCNTHYESSVMGDKDFEQPEVFIPIDILSQVYKDLIDIVTSHKLS